MILFSCVSENKTNQSINQSGVEYRCLILLAQILMTAVEVETVVKPLFIEIYNK